jgi:hypothetical protein
MDLLTPSATLPHPHFTLDLCRYQLAAAGFYTATAAGGLNHVRHRGFPAREITAEKLSGLGLTLEMSEMRAGNSTLLMREADGALALLQGPRAVPCRPPSWPPRTTLGWRTRSPTASSRRSRLQIPRRILCR